MGFNTKYKSKSYYSTKKGEKIILWYEKKFQKFDDLTIEKFHKDELLIEPISKNMKYPREEEYGKSECENIGKYGSQYPFPQ